MSRHPPPRSFVGHLVVVSLIAGTALLSPTSRSAGPGRPLVGDVVSVDGISFRVPEPGTTV